MHEISQGNFLEVLSIWLFLSLWKQEQDRVRIMLKVHVGLPSLGPRQASGLSLSL